MGGSFFPVVHSNHTLAHYDAGGWEPSIASEAVIQHIWRERPLTGAKRTSFWLARRSAF